MTVLTPAPASPSTPAASVRPVPWARLAWVVWRRYRAPLVATVAVLALIATYLVVHGERMRSAYAAYLRCRPVDSARCEFVWQNFRDGYADPGLLAVVLLFLPAAVGAFVGAPVLGRELETGTFRYAWTQGVGRMRWAVAVIASGAVGVVVIMAAFGALVGWHDQPLVKAGITPRLHPTLFPSAGPAAAGWALAGFAVSVLAGLLWRRVLPGIVTAFAVGFGLEFLAATQLRPRYLPPLTTTSLDLSGRIFEIDQWWTKGGVRVSTGQVNSVLEAAGAPSINGGGSIAVHAIGPGAPVDPVQYLLQHGYVQVTSYQPGSRFWPFQWIEFGWLTALAVLLLALALAFVRRRPA